MIKEHVGDFLKKFCGYYFLKGICDDIRRDIAKLFSDVYIISNDKKITKVSQLEDVCKKADLNNEDAIKFILHHLDVSEDVFQGYKYFEFLKTPWYIRELLLSKYSIYTEYEIRTGCVYLYYKGHLIGGKNTSHIGELLDNIKKVNDELSDK